MSNKASWSEAGAWALGRVLNTNQMCGPDMRASGYFDLLTGISYGELWVRSATSANLDNAYGASLRADGFVAIVKMVGGGQSTVATGNTGSGDGTYYFSVEGVDPATLEAWKSGGAVVQGTDSDLDTGDYAGFGFCRMASSGTETLDNYSCVTSF